MRYLFVCLLLSGCTGLNAQGVLTITYNTPPATTTATLTPGAIVPAVSTLTTVPSK